MEALPMIFPQWEKWSAGLGGQTTKQTQKNKLIIERELLLQESLTLGVDLDFVAVKQNWLSDHLFDLN